MNGFHPWKTPSTTSNFIAARRSLQVVEEQLQLVQADIAYLESVINRLKWQTPWKT